MNSFFNIFYAFVRDSSALSYFKDQFVIGSFFSHLSLQNVLCVVRLTFITIPREEYNLNSLFPMFGIAGEGTGDRNVE